MTHGRAIQLIRAGGLDRYADTLVAALRPSVRLTSLEPTVEMPPGGSRLGGLPMLPAGMGWPRWDMTGYCESTLARWRARLAAEPKAVRFNQGVLNAHERRCKSPHCDLSFLAQLDLAQLPAVPDGPVLPTTGRLLFFYAVEESAWGSDPAHRGAWRVLHVEDGTNPVPTPPPVPCPVFQPCAVDVSVEQTLPVNPNDCGLDLSEPDELAFNLLRNDLVAPGPCVHRVGGFPELVQSGDMPLECQLAANGVCRYDDDDASSDPGRASLERGETDWLLLLQLDSDHNPNWMWGDLGKLYFWIRRQDLLAKAFDRTWCIQDCY